MSSLKSTALSLSFLCFVCACEKKSSAKKDEPQSSDATAGGFSGMYKVVSQTTTNVFDCSQPGTISDFQKISFFKLQMNNNIYINEKKSSVLELLKCDNESTCRDRLGEHWFTTQENGAWKTDARGSVSGSFESDKCYFSYSQAILSKEGTRFKVVNTRFGGEVAKLAGATECDDVDAYEKSYVGKVECSSIETIEADRL